MAKNVRGLGRDRAATAPFPKSCAPYFRFARFNTFPLYYLRAWHRLSCVGYAVSNFDLLSELWEHTQIQILFKHYSFIVIIICFFSYKLLIRSILHEFNVIYIWRGCCFTVRYFSLCFFDMKLSFFLVVG